MLIGHGLFQCSGAFVLNEERSLAFTLINQGYDVWVGNNRSIAGVDHVSLSHEDPEYWNWGLKELGIYDFAAMVDHVLLYSGFSKVNLVICMLSCVRYLLDLRNRWPTLDIHKEMHKHLLLYLYYLNWLIN